MCAGKHIGKKPIRSLRLEDKGARMPFALGKDAEGPLRGSWLISGDG